MAAPVADNTFILLDRDGRQRKFLERSSGLIQLALVDEAGQPIQRSQLTGLTCWLYGRDDPSRTIINNLQAHDLLADSVRFAMGDAVAITGASQTDPIVLTAAAHGYLSGDLIQIAGVKGNRAANGIWRVSVVDSDTVELIGAVGSGAYTSGGVAVKAAHVLLQSADNQILSAGVDGEEWHRLEVIATYGSTGQLSLAIEFPVRNLPKQ